MTSAKKIFQPVTSKSVCLIYELLHRDSLVSFPLTDSGRQRVDALVSSINGEYFGRTIYSLPEEKALAYLYFLIKDHPFIDGNKRTAVLVFEVVCEMNGLCPDYGDFGLDSLAIFVEKIKERDNQKVIRMLSRLLFDHDNDKIQDEN